MNMKHKLHRCPNCGRVCQNAAGLSAHLRSCRERPSVETLLALVEENLPVNHIAARLDVNPMTARLWLDQAGFTNYRKGGAGPVVCPECGREFKSSAGMGSHRQTCQKRPEAEILHEMVEREMMLKEMEAELGVHHGVVRAWLEDVGLGDYRVGSDGGGGRRNSRPLELVPNLAPMMGKTAGCERCEKTDECRERLVAGLWVLCEAPEEMDVVAAEMAGLLPSFCPTATSVMAGHQ
jgi:hypothetical protein